MRKRHTLLDNGRAACGARADQDVTCWNCAGSEGERVRYPRRWHIVRNGKAACGTVGAPPVRAPCLSCKRYGELNAERHRKRTARTFDALGKITAREEELGVR